MMLKIVIFLYIFIVRDQDIYRLVNAEHSGSKSELFGSFVSFINKLRSFFRIEPKEIAVATAKIEKRRRKIKKALHNFIDEAFYDKTNSKLEKHFFARTRDEPISQDTDLLAVQQIVQHGYEVEVHTVQTRDGYLLTLHRILPADEKGTYIRNKVVILHHGLMGSTDDWIILGPNKSLPYLLCKAGRDVWLTNARGNKYSRFHITYLDDSSEFWNFSFHEMGSFDLPAVLDYVRDKSESNSEIDFVGHSLGATALLVLLSSLPQYNKVLRSATLLAPLVFMYKIKGPLKLLAEFQAANGHNSLNFLGEAEFMPIEAFPHQVIEKYCQGGDRLCRNPLLLIANGGKEIGNKNILEKVLAHLPAGASVNTILHFVQLINSDRFQMYDYGACGNYETYNMSIPPVYDLRKTVLPLVLFSSYDDWLCTSSNILRILPFMPNVAVNHVIRNRNFSHTDFAWGEDAPKFVYELIVEILNHIGL